MPTARTDEAALAEDQRDKRDRVGEQLRALARALEERRRKPKAHAAEPARRPVQSAAPPREADWSAVFHDMRVAHVYRAETQRLDLAYIIDVQSSSTAQGIAVEVVRAKHLKTKPGEVQWVSLAVSHELIDSLSDADDRAILAALRGSAESAHVHHYYTSYISEAKTRFRIKPASYDLLLSRMCRTGRCRLRRDAQLHALRWDEGAPWQLALRARPSTAPDGDWELEGILRREGEEAPLTDIELVAAEGLVVLRGAFVRCQGAAWVDALRARVRVRASQRRAFIEELFSLPDAPAIDLPEGWNIREERAPLTPRLHVRAPSAGARPGTPIEAELWFEYDRAQTRGGSSLRAIFDAERWRVLPRDLTAEQAAHDRLFALGASPPKRNPFPPALRPDAWITPRAFPAMVRALIAEGWQIEASGKLFRRAGELPSMSVSSGVDWFDVSIKADFEGVSAEIEELLAALRRGETTVQLSDGSFGVVPEEWLARFGLFADLATVEHGRLRFRRSQIGLLDLLLSSQQTDAQADAQFERARDELRRSAKIEPADPPPSFQGELRPYQREGLGWLGFLSRIGFGGCLADDMGLGKTVQVLALLAARKAARGRGRKKHARASLVVAPRSLIFNWKNEAARFTPELRLLDHTGVDRRPPDARMHEHDLVLTTYGTLRRDAEAFAGVDFDYAILDEAQAIKNPRSDTAKAARVLRADHRLALSGTPVENHLGELWSLFEFLNPGILGRAGALAATGSKSADLSPEMITHLARALRPFILRRTKAQVAKDLPDRLEETMVCELSGKQRALYDKLRNHYRASLQKRVSDEGIERSTFQILEALLRLRQVACHPGLVDRTCRAEPSAKLEALFAELPALRDSGQKALIFSQFTSLLAFVRDKLDELEIPYEYLDGQTRDRAARVERFQSDPECPFFLISLKAGGLGLNLTAAEYVFLLDPWWNPAVEAQAIDRAHRIGQRKPVFAYRLIAKDTIEERIAELQHKKRKLAESVIEGDGGLLRELTVEDLDLLLS